MNIQWIKNLKIIGSRVIVVYVLSILAVLPFLNYPKLKENAIGQTMSRFVPPIEYYTDLVKPSTYDSLKLHLCVSYHKRVAVYFPFQKAEALAMMGFCQELLGRSNEAIASYKSSVQANADYFWPYYDLGLLLYKKGKYSEAVDYLKEVLQKDLRVNLFMLSRSKIYVDVRLSDSYYANYDWSEAMLKARLDAYVMMMESLVKLEHNQELFEVASLGIKEHLGSEDIFYYYAGRAVLSLKSYEQSLKFLELAVEKNPNNSDALLYLGFCMHAVNKEDVAKKLFIKAEQVMHDQGSVIQQHLNHRVQFF